MALIPTAFLVHQDTIHYTESASHPVGTLLESVWSRYPQNARTITRSRIFHVEPLTPLCFGMIKVVGKRATQLDSLDFGKHWTDSTSGKNRILHSPVSYHSEKPASLPDQSLSPHEAMEVARDLARHSKLGIAALLLDSEGKILSWGWNDHFNNRVMHAEVMVVKNHLHHHEKKIPGGCTLISTLQPCAMCAGYLHGHVQDFLDLTILYGEDDPGPFAQNSILIRDSDLHRKSGLIGIPRIFRI